MASSVITANLTTQHHMDRLDAARALLGVTPGGSPPSLLDNSNNNASRSISSSSPSIAPRLTVSLDHRNYHDLSYQSNHYHHNSNNNSSPQQQTRTTKNVTFMTTSSRGVNGLDALAALASKEQASLMNGDKQIGAPPAVFSSTSLLVPTMDDEDVMPPPAPRGGRRRAVSNPEGMDKWAEPMSRNSRRHFVLPASILEEELAEASAAMKAQKTKCLLEEEDEDESSNKEEDEEEEEDSSGASSPQPVSGLMSAEEQANLTPEELLRRARSRLLEDLSESNVNGDKGVLTLPHSLSKYKDVYNKNGRIGIYTPAERAAIIARFKGKRTRRVWNKKIRYNCRKNLADRRMRVKGRFVKRSTEQQAKAKDAEPSTTGTPTIEEGDEDNEDAPRTEDFSETMSRSDEDMPDVQDPDAGFCPTEDQPYRRTRRHTIT